MDKKVKEEEEGNTVTMWNQITITLKARSRGCHLITSEIMSHIGPMIKKYQMGLVNLFIQHTSASLTINENYDKDVQLDMEDSLNRLVPEDSKFRHTTEGKDDMPAHVKSSLMGSSLTISHHERSSLILVPGKGFGYVNTEIEVGLARLSSLFKVVNNNPNNNNQKM